jgi:hypothetical protein
VQAFGDLEGRNFPRRQGYDRLGSGVPRRSGWAGFDGKDPKPPQLDPLPAGQRLDQTLQERIDDPHRHRVRDAGRIVRGELRNKIVLRHFPEGKSKADAAGADAKECPSDLKSQHFRLLPGTAELLPTYQPVALAPDQAPRSQALLCACSPESDKNYPGKAPAGAVGGWYGEGLFGLTAAEKKQRG